jgi:hypothetical protein
MSSGCRPFVRLFLFVVAIGASAPTSPTPQYDQLARALPEVRLRKIHLVRPDLIPYPLSSEILC